MLTAERLREVLHYDPVTGVFTWLRRQDGNEKWNGRWAGKSAGSLSDKGYILIRVDYSRYRAHRLAYLYMENYIPEEVDHIDHCRSNNAWDNLRDADRTSNGQNVSMHATNTSGFTGVYWNKEKGLWQAQITVNGKNISLGRYASLPMAQLAREAANDRYGFHENHGKNDDRLRVE